MSRRRSDISVRIDEAFAFSLSSDWLKGIARRVLDAEGVAAVELGIVVTDGATVQALNRQYAGEDTPTDVLSFSLNEGEPFVSPPDGILRLGEVVIAYPMAVRQAAEHGRSTETEVAHLLIHGVLHLLGYDHGELDEERHMRAKEEALLAAVMSHNG